MLYLRLGECDRKALYGKKYIRMPQSRFDFLYEETWLDSQFARKVIKEVDKSEVICGSAIESSVLGPISPKDISTGAKALILLECLDDVVMNGERLGDNCWSFVFELANKKDIHIALYHFLDSDYMPEKIEFFLENTGELWSGGFMDFLLLCERMFAESRGIFWDKPSV